MNVTSSVAMNANSTANGIPDGNGNPMGLAKRTMKKKGVKNSYNVKEFVKEIELLFFTPHEQKFWLFYKNVNMQNSFKDVFPLTKVINPFAFPLWEYHVNDIMISPSDNSRIVT